MITYITCILLSIFLLGTQLQMASKQVDSDSSDEGVSNFYSSVASRFKQKKNSAFPSGVVKIVDKPINKSDSSKKRARSPDLDSDSSDEDIFRDLNLSRKAEEDDEDADESQDYKNLQQVETLKDVEAHICISPDREPYCVSVPVNRENHSSFDIQEVEEEVDDDDPLLGASINDSVL